MKTKGFYDTPKFVNNIIIKLREENQKLKGFVIERNLAISDFIKEVDELERELKLANFVILIKPTTLKNETVIIHKNTLVILYRNAIREILTLKKELEDLKPITEAYTNRLKEESKK